MEEFDVVKFDPNIAALTEVADGYRSLTIAGIDDKEGYEKVHAARMDLKARRVVVEKTAKAARQKALDFQKLVISHEKELIGIIEPLELSLHAMENAVDEEKERIKRRALLPERREKCEAIGLTLVLDDTLLSMDPERFVSWYNEQKEVYLNAKETAMREAQAKLDKEKLDAENLKNAEQRKRDEEARLEQARKETAERVERETKERIEREAQEKTEREAKEQAALEGKKKYMAFLTKNGVNESFPTYPRQDRVPANFIGARLPDGTFSLYELVDSIKL